MRAILWGGSERSKTDKTDGNLDSEQFPKSRNYSLSNPYLEVVVAVSIAWCKGQDTARGNEQTWKAARILAVQASG